MSVLTQSYQCGTWFVCSILRELAVSNLGQPLFCLSITWSRCRNAYRDLWIMTIALPCFNVPHLLYTFYHTANISAGIQSFTSFWLILSFVSTLDKDFCVLLCCVVLYCIALHCIALHCIALRCIVLICDLSRGEYISFTYISFQWTNSPVRTYM